MCFIVLRDWQDGLRKVDLDKLLAKEARMGLSEGKRAVDRLMSGQQVRIGPFSSDEAAALVKRIESLGAVCELEQVS